MGILNTTKIITFILLLSAGHSLWSDKLIEVNRVVARVNDEVITWGEIELAMEKLNFSEDEKQRRAEEFIDGRIDRLLSQVAFESKGMAIPDSYIEQEYNSKLMSNFNGDRRLFREVLQSNGQSPLEYKEQLKEDIVHMHMLAQRKRTSDEISPQSVEDYYNQNRKDFVTEKRIRLSEIVITQGEDNSANTAEALANSLHSSILSGTNFEQVATQNGQSPFREKAGDWGVFVSVDEIRNPKLKEVSFSLKKGEVSKPFKVRLLEKKTDGSVAPSGKSAWYILKVSEIEKPRQLPMDEVRSEIEKAIANKLEQNEQRKWLARQKRDAYVDVRLPAQ
jgi:parvulin-like peptidyl-prolyl isomerase